MKSLTTQDWKIANLSPVFKKEAKQDPGINQ